MHVVFAILAVAIPIAEIVVFALVADAIGVLPTILVLLVMTAAGAVLLVREGISTLRRLRETVRRREPVGNDLADAALVTVGGILFLTPGFFTDALGFVILFPPTRRSLRVWLKRLVTGVAATRLGWQGKAAVGAKKVYDVKVTRATRGSGPPEPPPQLPSSPRPSGEDDSPDTG